MTLHYRTDTQDGVGTTAAAVEAIATLTTDADCVDVLGFFMDAVSTGAMTTGEALSGQFIINAREMANGLLEIQIPTGTGGCVVTNIGPVMSYGMVYPFKSIISDVGNKPVDFSYDALIPEPTSEMCAITSLMFHDGHGFKPEVMLNNGLAHNGGLRTRCNWTQTAVDDASGTVLNMAFPAAQYITVPGYVKEIVAIGIQVNPDAAVTAGEHQVSYISISGTIPNLYPMQVPTPSAFPTLGAPAAHKAQECYQRILPMHIPCPGVDSTLYFNLVMDTVTSGALAPVVTLYGRQ